MATDQLLRLRAPAHRVDRKAIGYWALGAVMFWALVYAVQLVVAAFTSGPHPWLPYTLCVAAVLAVVHIAVMPWWRYAVHRWEITEHAVFTQAGWLRQQWRIAPLSRLQTVDVVRNPFSQMFGLAQVTITTASAAGAVHIDGLSRETAQELVDHLAEITQATSGDAT